MEQSNTRVKVSAWGTNSAPSMQLKQTLTCGNKSVRLGLEVQCLPSMHKVLVQSPAPQYIHPSCIHISYICHTCIIIHISYMQHAWIIHTSHVHAPYIHIHHNILYMHASDTQIIYMCVLHTYILYIHCWRCGLVVEYMPSKLGFNFQHQNLLIS